jgi:protein-S-isoprenylcysteine O-methyltransferase Ste14
MHQIRGYLYVAVQFACVGAILLTGPIVPPSVPAALLLLVSVLLGLWAVLSMGLGRFRITPYLHPAGRLHRRGPYRVVRHPMYLALLLAMLGSVAGDPSAARFGVWLLLIGTLVLKLRMEEKLLAERHSEYAAYAATTCRMLPFVY